METSTKLETYRHLVYEWKHFAYARNRFGVADMDGILPQDSLGIADRLRRTKGRDSRTRSLASRFTPAEERELVAAAASEGKFTAEWTRDALLRAARARSTDGAVITELVALRMLLSPLVRDRISQGAP
jgi:hypothetical protein